jgi:hypothetical protein
MVLPLQSQLQQARSVLSRMRSRPVRGSGSLQRRKRPGLSSLHSVRASFPYPGSVCRDRHKRKDRNWNCKACRLQGHRDLVGGNPMHRISFGNPPAFQAPIDVTYLGPSTSSNRWYGRRNRPDKNPWGHAHCHGTSRNRRISHRSRPGHQKGWAIPRFVVRS